MKKYKPIDVELLKSTYRYENGELIDIRETVINKRWGVIVNPFYGKPSGSVEACGYVVCWLGGERFKRHRLIWALHHGDPGSLEVDHKDRVRGHDVIDNLRACGSIFNGKNLSLSSRNTSGFKGVSRDGKRWKASIMIDGKLINLGRYNSPEKAHEAYKKASDKLHGEYGYAGNN